MRHESYGRRTTDVSVRVTSLRAGTHYNAATCNATVAATTFLLTAWLHVFTVNSAEELVFGFRFGEPTRHTWLQQPLRCTLQRCSEYSPLHCSVVVSTRPYIDWDLMLSCSRLILSPLLSSYHRRKNDNQDKSVFFHLRQMDG
jgi:hypothetical protein